MKLIISSNKLKKVKTLIKKWLTDTELLNKEIFISQEMGFIKIYMYHNNIELGTYVDCQNSIYSDKAYKVLFSDFENVIKKLKRDKNSIIELEIDNNGISFNDLQVDNLFINVISVETKVKEEVGRTLGVSNFDIENSLEFLKPLINNNEIKVLNYTHFNLDENLMVSIGNLISVGNAEININPKSELKWSFSILNDNMNLLYKWTKANPLANVIMYKADKFVCASEESYIRIPYEENENSKMFIKFKHFTGNEKDKIDLTKLKKDLIKALAPYKGSSINLNALSVICEIKVGELIKKVDAYNINKIISKNNDIEIFLLDRDEKSPLIINDKNSKGKIIFNVLR